MQVEEVIRLIQQNGKPALSMLPDLDSVITDYPWFSIAYQLRLKVLYYTGSEGYNEQLAAVAARTVSREQLYNFIYLSKNIADTNPDLDAAFSLQPDDVVGVPEREVDVPLAHEEPDGLQQEAPDYFSLEESRQEDDANAPKSAEDLLDRFIAASPRIVPQLSPSGGDDIQMADSTKGIVSETLANIYVEQGLYNKAIEAYKELSLQNPEKRAYFAALIKKIKER